MGLAQGAGEHSWRGLALMSRSPSPATHHSRLLEVTDLDDQGLGSPYLKTQKLKGQTEPQQFPCLGLWIFPSSRGKKMHGGPASFSP